MSGNGAGNWIAAAALVLTVPATLVAYRQLNEGEPSTETVASVGNGGSDSDQSGGQSGSGQSDSGQPDSTQSGGGSGGSVAGDDSGTSTTEATEATGDRLDVSDCQITVDHIGAEIHESPDHSSRVLASVPSGDYSPLAATIAPWAGRDELWYQLEVDGRTGWLVYSTILVAATSSGCP